MNAIRLGFCLFARKWVIVQECLQANLLLDEDVIIPFF